VVFFSKKCSGVLTPSEKTEKNVTIYIFILDTRQREKRRAIPRKGKVSNKRYGMSVSEGKERPLGSCLIIGTTAMA
jgi:hypothetical protein